MTDRDRICAWLESHGPATSGQINRALGLDGKISSGALVQMERQQRVERCGMTPLAGYNGSVQMVHLWRATGRRVAVRAPRAEPAREPNVPMVRRALEARTVLEQCWSGAA